MIIVIVILLIAGGVFYARKNSILCFQSTTINEEKDTDHEKVNCTLQGVPKKLSSIRVKLLFLQESLKSADGDDKNIENVENGKQKEDKV